MKYEDFEKLLVESLTYPNEVIADIKNSEFEFETGVDEYRLGLAYCMIGKLDDAEKYIKKAIGNLEDEYKVIIAYIEMGSIKCRTNNLLDGLLWFYSALEKSYLFNDKSNISIILLNISYILLKYDMTKEAIEICETIDLECVKEVNNSTIYYLLVLSLARFYYKVNDISKGNQYKEVFENEFADEETYIIEKYKNRMLLEEYIKTKNIEKGEKIIKWLTNNIKDKNRELKYTLKYISLMNEKLTKEEKVYKYNEILKKAIKNNNNTIAFECIEKIYKLGKGDIIPKEICITMFLSEIKKNKEEKQSLMNFSINNISEKLTIKKHLLSRKDKINKLSEEISDLKIESIKDGLTGAYNRLFLDGFSTDSIRKKFFTVAFMDLDNFKEVNDRRGHIFGDRVLVEIATSLEYLLGNKGQLIRFGGDEFIIFYQHNDIGEGLELIKEVHRDINNLSISRYKKYNVGISTGALTIINNRVKDKSIYKYIEECDVLMYKVKGNNKNNFIHKYIC